MSKFFFSIIIPCYNVEKTITKTIESINTQTFRDFEVIFVNDGSIDNTLSILKNSKINFSHKIIDQKNKKIGAARNIAIKNCSGKYLSFLDADDYWEKEKLKIIFNELKNTDIDIICHNEIMIDKLSNTEIKLFHGKYKNFRDLFFKGNCLSTSAVTVNRDLVIKLNGFSEDLRINGVEDYDLWIRIYMQTSKIKFIPQFLGYYVINGFNISKESEYLNKLISLYLLYTKKLNLSFFELNILLRLKFIKLVMRKLISSRYSYINIFKYLYEIFILFTKFKYIRYFEKKLL